MNEVSAEAARAGDAAGIAMGSGVVLVAGVVDQGARVVLTGTLAAALGAAAFGGYTWVVTVAVLLGTLAPMGLQTAIVLFGARYEATGDRARLKGAVFVALIGALVFGTLAAVGLIAAAPFAPAETGDHLRHAAPVVALHAVLLTIVGAGRAVRELRPQAIAYQAVLPVGMLLGSCVALAIGAGLDGILAAFVVAYAAAVGVGGWLLARRLGPRLVGATAVTEAGAMLAFGVPQGLTDLVYRLVMWMDVLLLAPLAGAEQVGLYRVAATVAFMGSMPVYAVHTAFHPVVAAQIASGELGRLDALLRTLTRWLVLAAAGPFLFALLLPDAILGALDPAYAVAAPALVLLLVGQAVHVVCAATVPLVPMSGRSGLELANGVCALVIVVVGDLLLVPAFGAVGAAASSAVAFSAWSGLRLVEAWWILGSWPFDGRTARVLGVAVGAGSVAAVAGAGASLGERLVWVALAEIAFGAAALRWGLTPEDGAAWEGVRRRITGGRPAP